MGPLLEDLQRRAAKRAMTTALGPDSLSYFIQSEARWGPGHRVWWWVCLPSLGVAGLVDLPQDSLRGQLLLPPLPLRFPENWVEGWVEAVGEPF